MFAAHPADVRIIPASMAAWCRTHDGWAVNLDGTDAALAFTLPRIELHSSPRGWACVCHLENGTSRLVPLAPSTTAAGAMRAGIEGSASALGTRYGPQLRTLLQT
jgi:hypothetical protein